MPAHLEPIDQETLVGLQQRLFRLYSETYTSMTQPSKCIKIWGNLFSSLEVATVARCCYESRERGDARLDTTESHLLIHLSSMEQQPISHDI